MRTDSLLDRTTRVGQGAFYTTGPAGVLLAGLVHGRPRTVVDPSCGDGELLVAARRRWPDTFLMGWDIDRRAVESARLRLPEAHLTVLPYGPQPDGTVRLGALDVLLTDPDMWAVDLVMLNPPYTAQKGRYRQYPPDVQRAMRDRELVIRDHVLTVWPAAGHCLDPNAVGTFFRVVAHWLLP